MSAAVDFHSQIASIMEVLANAAVAEICKVVDDGYAVVHLEMSRRQKENEFLRRKIKLLELQISRYRAERVKGAEGSVNSRFPGVRLLNRPNRDSVAGMFPPALPSTQTRYLGKYVKWITNYLENQFCLIFIISKQNSQSFMCQVHQCEDMLLSWVLNAENERNLSIDPVQTNN